MKLHLISAAELDDGVCRQWRAVQETRRLYDSPYYHPAYTQAVAAARSDVRILLLEDGNQIGGFFPFHRRGRRMLPVGEGLTDYQGPIAHPDAGLTADGWLRAAGARYFGFNHMPADIKTFSDHAWTRSRSLQLDLRGGYQAYIQRLLDQRDASVLKKADTNRRKLSNRFGDLRFDLQSLKGSDFEQLIVGKSDQFRRTVGADHDIFSVPWIRQTVDHLFQTRQPDFGGMLSTLFAGDTLIAAHFGIYSDKVLHYWFPWYDTEYASFSPGLILLASCAEKAAEIGMETIDLGRGEQAYKQRFATGSQELCEGAVSRPMLQARMEGQYYQWRTRFKDSAFGQKIREWKQGAGQSF